MKNLKHFAFAALFVGMGAYASAETIYGNTENNRLISWDSATPGTILNDVAITGMVAGDILLGIDFRPANNLLYGVSGSGNLYTIDRYSGAAVSVQILTTPPSGNNFGFDFNPAADRLRIVSDADQNLRLLVPTTTFVDGALAYGAADTNFGVNPNVVHSAYTNNFPGAPSTVLFGIDSDLDILVKQNPPNNGTLETIGSLGIDIGTFGGFDVSRGSQVAYGAFNTAGAAGSSFYTMNLNTGAATLVGAIGGGQYNVRGMTAVPEPATMIALGAGALALIRRRRKSA